jgi:segregation and condensation protein B
MSVIDYSWDFSKEEFSLDLDFFNEKDQEDKMWQARTGLNYETLCGAIETIIFMNDKPVNLQKIKNTIDSDLPLRVVHESIARLQEEYEAKHHGIRLMEVAQGYQFRTKATYSKIVQKMFKVSSLQLSPTALEVLSIVAYKQPISKAAVESIRGVDSSHIIRALMDRRLVRITGRSDEMGRPSLYGTTPEFLEVFNLNDVADLPSEAELEELATASNLASISEIKEVVQKGDRKRFDLDELQELDQLAEEIKEIASDTLFTKSLKMEEKRRNDGEGHEKKTAFDILEEYLDKTDTLEQNKLAADSDTLMNILEAKVINPLGTDELFNTPEMDEDFDQLLDERQLPEVDKEVEQSLEGQLDDSEMNAVEEESDKLNEEVDYLFENTQELDPVELADALDEAFDNLFGSDDDNAEQEKQDEANAQFLEEGIEGLKESETLIAEKAKDLDLDLDFLNNNDE